MSHIANGKTRPPFALLHFSTGQPVEVAPALNILSVRTLPATATSPDDKKKWVTYLSSKCGGLHNREELQSLLTI